MCVCVCVCVCVCTYIYTDIYLYMYTHTHIYTYIQTRTRARVHTHTHTHTNAHYVHEGGGNTQVKMSLKSKRPWQARKLVRMLSARVHYPPVNSLYMLTRTTCGPAAPLCVVSDGAIKSMPSFS